MAELVYEAFFLHGLLLDAYNQGASLSLPNSGEQRDRMDKALDERNKRMVGTGQEFWAHRCQICMQLFEGPDGKICGCSTLKEKLPADGRRLCRRRRCGNHGRRDHGLSLLLSQGHLSHRPRNTQRKILPSSLRSQRQMFCSGMQLAARQGEQVISLFNASSPQMRTRGAAANS